MDRRRIGKSIYYSLYLRTRGLQDVVREYELLRNWRKMPTEEQRAVQDARFREIVRFAARWVPFYRRLYREHRVDVRAIKGTADAPLLPIVTREMMESASARDLRPGFLRKPALQIAETGGCSGRPLRFYRSMTMDSLFAGQIRWLFNFWRVNTGLKILYLQSAGSPAASRDLNLSEPMSFFDRRYTIDPAVGPREVIDWITEERPDLVITHPSVVEELAENIIPIRGPYLGELVFAFDGEVHSERLLARIRETFPVSRVYRLYRSAEIGLIATECIHRHGFHILEPAVYLESGETVPIGDEHTIHTVVTSLLNFGTPFIRYSGLNDLVRFTREECRYAGSTPMISELVGRRSDVVFSRDGRGVSVASLFNRTCDILGIRNFQYVQDRPGQILFRYTALENAVPEIVCSEARKIVAKRLGDDFDFSCEQVEELTPALNSPRKPVRLLR